MWKDINGWEGLYEVNENGEVRNKRTGALVKGDKNNLGYNRVALYHDNKREKKFRHRLVAEHFIPNPQNLPQVNHKDLNKDNNSVENLEWINQKYNNLHACVNGARVYRPFVVQFDSGETLFCDNTTDLIERVHVTKRSVLNWLHKKNHGYINHGINSIEYVDSCKCLTTIESNVIASRVDPQANGGTALGY